MDTFFRTDLAMEALQMNRQQAQEAGALSGVRSRERQCEGFSVTTVEILDETGAKELQKPIGIYETMCLDALMRREEDAFPRACLALADLLRGLLPQDPAAPVLVVGLGNRAITPDAVGPRAADHIIATRHLIGSAPHIFADWRPVCALAPGVLGQTGMEVGEVLAAVVEQVRPAVIVAVDALAAGSVSRLCRTIQLTDAGIVPGSGVQNARAALNEKTLGVPVIAVGAPTVVDGRALLYSLTGEQKYVPEQAAALLVTTRDIDREAADLSRLIGYALDLALQPGLRVSDIDLYLS